MIKEAINASLRAVSEDLAKGSEDVPGTAYLSWLAKNEPKSYAALLAKMVPQQIKAEVEAKNYIVQVVTGLPAGLPGSEILDAGELAVVPERAESGLQ